MILTVDRVFPLELSTIGHIGVDGMPQCFSLEDKLRPAGVKVPGETAIPPGIYRTAPREAGRLYGIYNPRWSWHRGMIWLQNVQDFKWIYFHAGVTRRDTLGCVLTGYAADVDARKLAKARAAYEAVYRRVVDALYAGDLEVRVGGVSVE